MAALALFATPDHAPRGLAETATGATVEAAAPAIDRLVPDFLDLISG